MVQELREKDPRTKWVERRWARDGKVWTSGALLNGLDMMKEFMAENWPELTEIAVRTGGLPVRDVEYVGKDGMLA
jgi:transcriptional regulator GlxA family with amidase domain